MYNCLRENQQYVNLNRDKSENIAESKAGLQNAMSNVSWLEEFNPNNSFFSYDSSATSR